MSESLVGVSVAATRQKDGKLANTAPPRPPAPPRAPAPARLPAGGVNAPAAIVCANVIVVFGSTREARLSHEAAPAVAVSAGVVRTGAEVTSAATNVMVVAHQPRMDVRRFMIPPPTGVRRASDAE